MIRQLVRRFKWAYSLYNIFHRDQLQHNVAKYRALGLSKFYFSPVSSKDFKKVKSTLKKDRNPDLDKIRATSFYQQADEETRKSLEQFEERGYAIVNGFLKTSEVDAINQEIVDLLEKKRIQKGSGGKIMFAIHQSDLLRGVGMENSLLDLLSLLMDGKATLFQSINFIHGSEQHSHSDSIHMTTYPLGGLLGVWIALEDIHPDNGPLHYYPGSHKLPYYLNEDYGNEGSLFLLGKKDYDEYEAFIRQRIETLGLKKEVLCIPKGTMMIWHANLFHGGEPHLDKSKTRKSVVFHYFDENSICYHEITQRPALMRTGINHQH
jgi:hypothetical protein